MGALDKLVSLTFSTLISKPFIQWEAYKLGLIDNKGNKIKEPKDKKERASLSTIKNLVRKVKRTINKFVPDTPTINFLVANMILKESDESQIDLFEGLTITESAYLIDFLECEIKKTA